MPTLEEESRKLLCLCGKHHGTFNTQDCSSCATTARRRPPCPTGSATLRRLAPSCSDAGARRVALSGVEAYEIVGSDVYERVDIDG
jgi:hypothetical protein